MTICDQLNCELQHRNFAHNVSIIDRFTMKSEKNSKKSEKPAKKPEISKKNQNMPFCRKKTRQPDSHEINQIWSKKISCGISDEGVSISLDDPACRRLIYILHAVC